MINKKRLAISILIGAIVTACAMLPFDIVDNLLMPGWVFASPFWPEGIESDGLSTSSFYAMVIVVWCGSFVAWSFLAYLAVLLIGKVRAA